MALDPGQELGEKQSQGEKPHAKGQKEDVEHRRASVMRGLHSQPIARKLSMRNEAAGIKTM
jgi:hypothetical protein